MAKKHVKLEKEAEELLRKAKSKFLSEETDKATDENTIKKALQEYIKEEKK